MLRATAFILLVAVCLGASAVTPQAPLALNLPKLTAGEYNLLSQNTAKSCKLSFGANTTRCERARGFMLDVLSANHSDLNATLPSQGGLVPTTEEELGRSGMGCASKDDDAPCGCDWYRWGYCTSAIAACAAYCIGTYGTGCAVCLKGLSSDYCKPCEEMYCCDYMTVASSCSWLGSCSR
jgi:hypothetical protein